MNLNQIYVADKPSSEIALPLREVLYFLGVKGEPEKELKSLIDECMAEFIPAVSYKASFCRLPISDPGDTLSLGFAEVKSTNLKKNLYACKEIILLSATCGAAVDRLIQRYSRLFPGKALIMDALGGAAIESFADTLCADFKDELKGENLFLRPRFSPGYGDFDLAHQREIFRFLDSSRKIGLSLTDSLLMTPTKSVSAVIGISEIDTGCIISGCEACPKDDCAFRRA